MESRHDLYHKGNTVIPPHPGKKRKYKTMQQDEQYKHTGKVMPYQPKVCATSACVWCNTSFGGRYMIFCTSCRNCQYCGLISTTSMKLCRNCGNALPEELNVGGGRLRV